MRGSKYVKLLSVFVLLIVLLVNTIAEPITVIATESNNQVTKEELSHDIAIVFDNSGSMYNNNDRWSQALYALEVFASMLNYKDEQGDSLDRLTIYPMAPISVGKKGNKTNKLEIKDKNDVKKIEKIYSPHTAWTILSPAYKAAKDLQRSNLDEKWLILLTDGDFVYNRSTNEKKTKEYGFTKKTEKSTWPDGWLEKKLKKELCPNKKGVKFQYLRFQGSSSIKSDEANDFYAASAGDNNALIDQLIKICNRIFRRDKIESISDGVFETDVSMSKIIAFIQEKDGEIGEISLTNLNKKSVIKGQKTVIHSGTEGTGSNYKAIPANITGQIVTFENCDVGTYKLEYPSGAKINVFYEPNVKIKTTLLDDKGNEVDTSKEVEPENYKVKFGLVDAKSNQPVNSDYITNIDLSAEVSNNGRITKISSGDKIELKQDAQTSIRVSGSFRGTSNDTQYKINNDDDSKAFNISVKLPSIEKLELKLSTEQFGKWFKLSDYENWKSIRLDVKYGGKALSDKQLEQVAKTLKINPISSEKLSYNIKPIKGKSAFEIMMGENSETGKHSLEATASIKDKFNQESKGSDSIGFEIQWYSQLWKWLFWLLLFLLLVLLVLWWMSRKVLPKNINVDQNGTSYMLNFNPLEMKFRRPTYNRKAKLLTITTPPGVQVPLSITCKLKAVDRRWTKSKNRRLRVEPIKTNAETANIAGGIYQYENGKIVKKPTNISIFSNSIIKLERTDIEGNFASFAYKIKRL